MHALAELMQQLSKQLKKNSHGILPSYKVLYELLRQQILDGLLLPGMRLPSSRLLATKLKIARNTALAALNQLCAEGYAEAREKSGIFVLSTTPVYWNKQKTIIPSKSLELSDRGKKISIQAQYKPMTGAFAVGVPDLKQFPFVLWQRCLARYAKNPKLVWQINSQHGSDPELRRILADYLRISRSICCDPKQILITSGTQHGLQLVADLLADTNDTVWMENPGYQGACCAFNAAGLNIMYQPLDTNGLSPTPQAWKKPPRFIYVTPSHQFPTGVVMSASRRRQLLTLAAQHQTWIIEDDYDSEFRHEGTPIAAMQALSPEQVIYLGTFSKTFFPAFRVGYMVLPESIVDAFSATHARHLRGPSLITQKALTDFIREGHASSHIRKMRREYQLRRDTLIQVLKTELNNLISFSGIETGLHLLVYLPKKYNDVVIAEKACQNGIAVKTLSQFCAENHPVETPGLVLGFGDVNQRDITRMGKKLCQIIRES